MDIPSLLPQHTATPATEEIKTARVVVDGCEVTLLGTAHVSKTSAHEVEELVRSGHYGVVAVELCQGRYQAIIDPDALKRMDLGQILKEGKMGMVAAHLALAAYQRRLGYQLGVEPGLELRMAIDTAKLMELPVELIDRDVGITLNRAYKSVPWWQRFVVVSGLMAALITRDKISAEDIEQLKQGDMLQSVFSEFASHSPALFRSLVSERDEYMAARIRQAIQQSHHKHMLVIIGAGHLAGLQNQLTMPAIAPPAAERIRLESIPPSGQFAQSLPWLLTALFLGLFVVGFLKGPGLGLDMLVQWALITAGAAALGGIVSMAHPLTTLGAALAAPITTLHPVLGAGFVAASLELIFRKPQVADFGHLSDDLTHFRGWWHNRVARTVLVFLFVSISTSIGAYVAAAKLLGQLTG